MSGSIKSLEQSLRTCEGCGNDHDYICQCRPVDVRAALVKIASLQAMLDTYPKTKDGVLALHGSRLYREDIDDSLQKARAQMVACWTSKGGITWHSSVDEFCGKPKSARKETQ